MKIQLLARPDHSLFLYNYIKKKAEVHMVNFNVAKKGSLLHKMHPAAKLVDEEVTILYDLILFAQLIFKLGKTGMVNPYKWEGRYAEWAFERAAKRYLPDIIHYWPVYCSNYVRKQRSSTKVTTVADVYSAHPNFVLDVLRPEYEKYGLDIKTAYFYKDAERLTHFLQHEENIITNSDYVKKSMLTYNPEKNTYVADYGFLGDADTLPAYEAALRFQQTTSQKILRIVYIGTVSIEKGVHYLLQAFKQILPTQAELYIIGNIKQDQIKIFQPYFNQKGIHFLGFKSNKEIKKTLKNYSVLALPSLSDANSIAVIEGLQNALPVIVTDATGNKDAVEKYNMGEVVPAGNSESLLAAIEKLRSTEYRNHLAENIRSYIVEDAQYPYPEKVLDIYRTLLLPKNKPELLSSYQ